MPLSLKTSKLTVNKVIADTFLAATKIKPAIRKPIPDDPWEFVRDCCYTFDELAKTTGLDPRRRFPDKAYLQMTVREWERNRRLRIEKSRQILITWLLAALWLHWVLKNRGQRVAWICKTFADASDHLQSRLQYIYQEIPSEWEKPVVEFVEGELRVFHDAESAIPTSRIEAIAAERGRAADAANQLRSFTYSGINWDEAAFQSGQDEIYAAALPCVGAGGRFNIVSSANGRNFFWRLGYGALDDSAAAPVGQENPPMQILAKGLQAWDYNAFRHLRIHYSADTEKDPAGAEGRAWFDAVRPSYSTRKWNREMEVDFAVPAGLPVFCDTEKISAIPQLYDPSLKVFVGLDFGFTETAATFSQIEPLAGESGKPVQLRMHVFKETIANNVTIGHFLEDYLLPYVARVFPRAIVEYYGDPAGHQRSDKTGESSIQVCAAYGIIVKTSVAAVDTRLDVSQSIISSGSLEVDPTGCPKLLAALRGGYHRGEDGLPVKDGEFDHVVDCWSYMTWNVIGLDKRAASGGVGARVVGGTVMPSSQANRNAMAQAAKPIVGDPNLNPTSWGSSAKRPQQSYTPQRRWNLGKSI